MITALVVLGFYRFQPLSASVVMMDPFLRWPVLVLIFSSAGLATYPLEYGWKLWRNKRQHSKRLSRLVLRLQRLTPNEKKVLQRYLELGETTCGWGRGGGAVDILSRDGILYLLYADPKPSARIDVYAIDDDAWKYLSSHPELVDLRPVTPHQA
jgi:hypothetical protein